MKKLIYLLLFVFIAGSVFVSCNDEDDNIPEVESPFKTFTLGAQDNSNDGFYSTTDNKTYNMAEAYTNRANIDLLCYYDTKNFTTIASPGAENLETLYTGENVPGTWDIADTTLFCEVDNSIFTVEMFNNVIEDRSGIDTLFDELASKKRAKNLAVDKIFVFQTEDGKYGLFKVNEVEAETTGYANITLIMKED